MSDNTPTNPTTPNVSGDAPQTPDESHHITGRDNLATDANVNDADTANTADVGQADVQRQMDEATAKGYFGVTPDPHPNEAYSLESGPDSPSAVDDHRTRSVQHSAKEA